MSLYISLRKFTTSLCLLYLFRSPDLNKLCLNIYHYNTILSSCNAEQHSRLTDIHVHQENVIKRAHCSKQERLLSDPVFLAWWGNCGLAYPWSFPNNVPRGIPCIGQRAGNRGEHWVFKESVGTDTVLLQLTVLLVFVRSGWLKEPRNHTVNTKGWKQ